MENANIEQFVVHLFAEHIEIVFEYNEAIKRQLERREMAHAECN